LRTKPTDARDKILKAERIRRQHLELDPAFKRELNNIETLANQLVANPAPRISAKEPSKIDGKDLLPTPDEEAFDAAAQRFAEKWNFRPVMVDNRLKLFTRMPVSYEILKDGDFIEKTRRGKYHPHGDVDALAKYYRSLREQIRSEKGKKPPAQRRRNAAQEQRLKALEMQAKGLTLDQITKKLSKKYKQPRKKKWSPEQDPRYRGTYDKYRSPPFSLDVDTAMKRADAEVREFHRREEDENRKLRERTRHLLKPPSKS
jgi:hypothetical protein